MHGTLTEDQYAAIAAVTARYARKVRSGHPMRCVASQAENAGIEAPRALAGTERKVIYDTADDARQAAAEIAQIVGGPEQVPYRCTRSRRGHHHLTDRNSAQSTLLGMTVDQNRQKILDVTNQAGAAGVNYAELLRIAIYTKVARDVIEAQMFIGSMMSAGLITRIGGKQGRVFTTGLVPPASERVAG